jgi:Uma2 family endonuclease
MAHAQRIDSPTDRFTYGLYCTWDDDQRWELIDGEPYCMSPAPSFTHQQISMNLSRIFSQYLIDKPCRPLAAPFDVRLPDYPEQSDDEISTVVQPDLVVVCDRSKIDEKGCKGAPDLVVEILSPSTAQRDLRAKFALYERHGVREYWVVQPTDRTIMVFRLTDEGTFGRHELFAVDEQLPVALLGDLVLDLREIFAE